MNAIEDKDEASEYPSASRNIGVNNDRIDSKDIFVGTREIMISHGDDVYRLRLTAQNKLILTK